MTIFSRNLGFVIGTSGFGDARPAFYVSDVVFGAEIPGFGVVGDDGSGAVSFVGFLVVHFVCFARVACGKKRVISEGGE